jgi:hypothetical protein
MNEDSESEQGLDDGLEGLDLRGTAGVGGRQQAWEGLGRLDVS